MVFCIQIELRKENRTIPFSLIFSLNFSLNPDGQ